MEGLKDTLEFLRSRTDVRPEVGLVLGSGLDFFHRKMKVEAAVPYAEIPGFPVSTVAGHAGRFLFGEIAGKKAVVMQGRVHYYEGYSMAETVLPVRAMIALGAKKLLLTNAAGGINPDFEVNTFMALKDHIACFVPSPLRGPNDEELGDLLGKKLTSDEEIIAGGEEFKKKGPRSVMVTLGRRGAYYFSEEGHVYHCSNATGTQISAVGAGDSSIAGFIKGLSEGKSIEETLQYSMAAGGATAFSPHLGSYKLWKSLLPQIKVTKIK